MIYIHIPYCHQKCTYCAFYSTPSRSGHEDYVDALVREILNRAHECPPSPSTIYLGGGTPSILSTDQLRTIIDAIRQCCDLSQLQEFTLEANPEDLSPEYLELLHRQVPEINRLSIGIQSFCDTDLHTINRRHTGQQAIQAVQDAHRIGYHNISVDLIFGLPNQSADDWKRNLDTLHLIEPLITHLSCYALTIEEGTMIHRQICNGTLSPADEDVVMADYGLLQQWISNHPGWQQYEISSYCKNGLHSRHNSRYWDRTPYVGIGAGAHSFDGRSRRWNVSSIDHYITHSPDNISESETLTPKDAFNEYLMTALRTTRGIDTETLRNDFPWAMEHFILNVQKHIHNNLLTPIGRHLVPTAEGILHADGIAADLFL